MKFFVKMPYSLKQLDLRYQDACNNLQDAKEYILQHLKATIEINLQVFFDDLHAKNLEECEAEFDMIEETIQQCRLAIRSEKSRRQMQDEIIRKTNENAKKTIRKQDFKLRRRHLRLRKATPYSTQSQGPIGY